LTKFKGVLLQNERNVNGTVMFWEKKSQEEIKTTVIAALSRNVNYNAENI
jgi:hypothetical protein